MFQNATRRAKYDVIDDKAQMLLRSDGHILWKDRDKWVITDRRGRVYLEPFGQRRDAYTAWGTLKARSAKLRVRQASRVARRFASARKELQVLQSFSPGPLWSEEAVHAVLTSVGLKPFDSSTGDSSGGVWITGNKGTAEAVKDGNLYEISFEVSGENGTARFTDVQDRPFMSEDNQPVPDNLVKMVYKQDAVGLAKALDNELGDDAYLALEWMVGDVIWALLGKSSSKFRIKAENAAYELRKAREDAEIAKSPWKKELKALGRAIATTVAPSDVPYIKYQPRKRKGVYTSAIIEDREGRLGNMRSIIDESDARQAGTDLKTVFQALDDMGAKLVRRGMGPGKKKPWIDYDGWAY